MFCKVANKIEFEFELKFVKVNMCNGDNRIWAVPVLSLCIGEG